MNTTCGKQHGVIHLVFGPMFSGKTSWMISHAKSCLMANKNVRIIIPVVGSERYTRKNMASSHDGLRMTALKVETLDEISQEDLQGIDMIGIDEGHFFKGLKEFCNTQACQGRDVVVAALKADANRENWPSIVELLPIVDHVHSLVSTCIVCGGEATQSKRIIERSNSEYSQVDTGGDEKYVATCGGCWYKSVPKGALQIRKIRVELLKRMTTEMGN